MTIGELKTGLLRGATGLVTLLISDDGKNTQELDVAEGEVFAENFWKTYRELYKSTVMRVADALGASELGERTLFDLPTFSSDKMLDILRSFRDDDEVTDEILQTIIRRVHLEVLREVLENVQLQIAIEQQKT